MSPTDLPATRPARQSRFFLELAVVVGLPVLSIFIGSALAIVAYTHGFTALTEPAAASAAPHHR
ncbi:MAG: hypothetical protein ISP90_15700 [Nevskia sp.]|jgi:hypothetical protein|nr:hypothetical protein [Nevskia sp.]